MLDSTSYTLFSARNKENRYHRFKICNYRITYNRILCVETHVHERDICVAHEHTEIIKVLQKRVTRYLGKYDTVITRRDGIPVVSSSVTRFCIVTVRLCPFFS